MLYFIIGCLIIGLFISFTIGWWWGERHVRRNTMVSTPSTSTNTGSHAIALLREVFYARLPLGNRVDDVINECDASLWGRVHSFLEAQQQASA